MKAIDTAPSARVELPYRRLTTTEELHWRGTSWLLSIGFNRQGFVHEIFLDMVRGDVALQGPASERAVAVSHALQSGLTLGALIQDMRDNSHPLATLIEDALNKCLTVQRLDREIIADAYRMAAGG